MHHEKGLVFPAVAALLAAAPAAASFHFMQIELVIGGIDGDSSAQVIQLRQRTGFQCFLTSGARLVVYDAAGANPVELIDFDADVPGCEQGDRILITSPGFVTPAGMPVAADFELSNLIPPSYLAAGSLTLEDETATVFWRLSWGGAGYTGPTTGTPDNDADGDFGPPVEGALPGAARSGLRFTGAASAPSTTNAGDYAVESGPTLITNGCDAYRLGAPCPWDCVCPADDQVGTLELLTVLASWGRESACDLDGGATGTSDLLGVLAHWGACPE